MTPQSPESLTINGTLQAETVVAALAATEAKQKTREILERMLRIHKDKLDNFPEYPDEFNVSMSGGEAMAIKADILKGLELLASGDSSAAQKIAAQALLEMMNA